MPPRSLDLQALSAIALPDADGREVRLGELWKDRPVALIFLRHFG